MRKMLNAVLLIVTILTLGVLTACTNKVSDTPDGNPETGKDPSQSDTDQPNASDMKTPSIKFWHSLSGEEQVALESIVEGFNESQDQVEVTAEFQVGYEKAMEKWQQVSGKKEAPALIQIEDLDTKSMLDSGKGEPIQTLADSGGIDITGLDAAVLNHYNYQDKLVSIPLTASIPMMVYNKDLFEEAGLDSEKGPELISELIHSGETLTTDQATGFSIPSEGWLFENWLAIIGGEYVNERNGRAGNATKAEFSSDAGRLVFRTLQDMNEAGTFKSFGPDWEDTRDAFVSEKTAIYLESSSHIEKVMSDAAFDVDVAFVPGGDELRREGVITSGSSVWVSNEIDNEQREGALTFLTYFLTPEVQAEWHVKTGYLASNPKAYEEETVQMKWENQPYYQAVIDQLHDAESSPVNQGALFTAHRESRQAIVTALEKMYEGKEYQAALAEAADRTNTAIEKGNAKGE
ncbi:ABC transporter substrate-binding protein [Sporosarcina jeotgali]|uniref:ABC transporter substrate-binding protein n=1 Tax=Sporosarcina jeotgali TaxID=3020056 RepID=A0ABZ0KXZ2_9BACL|nr:ABC transporter substrate-binding protein [Sporosarcina sp. B2O-1]WOV84830.1 ABC transporter substrate-binding protein [Sporosarcina sp. B2O-1]